MKTLKQALVGTAAATAMAVSATPAVAKHGHYKKDKISAGEVIAGAVVLGGLAAVLASSGKKDRYYDRGYSYRGDNYRNDGYRHSNYSYGYDRIKPRRAVKKCIRAAERRARHYGYADVTQIRDVERTRYGWKVKGRIAVKNHYRGDYYRSGYGNRHDRGYGYDKGKFSCRVEGHRVTNVRLKGLGNYR